MPSTSKVKRVGELILAAAVIGALGFGASQLLANNKADCPYPPYHGPCDAQGKCDSLCLALFPENGGEGVCSPSTHCCICAEH
jgi:hypothetical protein